MVEWNGGLDYWSGVLDWITGAPRPQMHNLVYLPWLQIRFLSSIKLAEDQ